MIRGGRGAAAMVILVVAATGCVAIPQERTARNTSWDPLPEKALRQAVRTYDDVGNRANAAEDGELIGRVEAGPLLEASQAAYLLDKRARKFSREKREPYKAHVHKDPVFFRPPFTGYPVWLISSSRVQPEEPAKAGKNTGKDAGKAKKPRRDLVVQVGSGARADWKSVFSVDIGTAKVPELTQVAGNVVPVAPGSKDLLGRSPKQIAADFKTLLGSSAPRPPQAGRFSSHQWIRDRLARNREDSAAAKKYPVTFAYQPSTAFVRAVGTKGGGALILFTIEESRTTTLGTGLTQTFSKDSWIRRYTGKAKATTRVFERASWQVAAVAPPKNAKNERVRLIGMSYQLLELDVS